MHLVLDVKFGENDCRIRTDKTVQSFAVLCGVVLNLIKSDATTNLGIANKHLKMGWNVYFLGKIL